MWSRAERSVGSTRGSAKQQRPQPGRQAYSNPLRSVVSRTTDASTILEGPADGRAAGSYRSRGWPALMVLLARDIMDPEVLTVVSTVDALTCARTLVEKRKGYAIVHRPDGSISGIVTEWDFLEKVLATGRDPSSV